MNIVSDSHPLKASCPKPVTLSGIVIEVRDLQFSKVLSPMFVTVSGIMIESMDSQDMYLEVIDYQLFAVNTVEKWIGSYLWVYGK